MDLFRDIGTSDLLQAHAHVWKHTCSFINSMSLKCAIELNIPDIIHKHGKPMSLSKLTSVLQTNSQKVDCISRLMRLLIHSGFFALQKFSPDNEEEGYVLTNASYFLLKDNPSSVSPFSLMILDPNMMKSYHFLSTWFKNDDPTPYYTTYGKLIWEHAGNEPRVNTIFNEAMASDCRFVADIIIKKSGSVFEGLKSLVDVGGGTGTLASLISQAFPDLECTVLDLPHVVVGLTDTDKLKYIGGNMFQQIPSADGILLKTILHDWNDEESVRILKQCKDAIMRNNGKGRKVILIEMVIGYKSEEEIEDALEVQLFVDMEMMAHVSGKERSEKEWAKLFVDAEFSHYKIHPILGERSIIELYP
ncbi:hypothetical protein ACFE04_027805 [Oxalis oulophora]